MPTKSPHKVSSEIKTQKAVSNLFEGLSDTVDNIIGTPYWFAFSLLIILVWFPSGFLFGFGEIWHLIINTTTTILTFLMMSLLHASQSKWESRIEKMEESQRVALNFLKKETERIAGLEEEQLNQTNASQTAYVTKEAVSSIN
jgi:low affinity Fe/Cu permease